MSPRFQTPSVRRHRRAALAMAAATSLLFIGCATGNYEDGRRTRRAGPMDSASVSEASSSATMDDATSDERLEAMVDTIKSEMAFPTGDRKTSAILLEKEMPSEVILNSEFAYRIRVQNLTDGTLGEVKVTDTIPSNLVIEGTEPVGQVAGDLATWDLGALAPRASKTLVVRGRATGTGSLKTCATVDYESKLCVQSTVVAPNLDVQLRAPQEALFCDPLELTVAVTNAGTGDARDVTVVNELPEGLTTMSGQRRVEMRFGTLAGAQSKEKTIKLVASEAGTFTHEVTAQAKGGLSTIAEPVTTVLREPRLDVSMTSTERALAGRPIETKITVANTGNGVSDETVLRLNLPQGAELLDVREDGDESGGRVEWTLGSIAPGESREVGVRFRGGSNGMLVSEAKASGRCAAEVTATSRTEVRGMPALLLEVVDESDLILVGDNVTYDIRVENQGSAPDTNVVVTCEVEEGIEIVGTGDAVSAQVSGRQITFDPIQSLAPGEKVILQVTVRSSRELDSRFKVSLTSTQKVRPVSETEATNFYK